MNSRARPRRAVRRLLATLACLALIGCAGAAAPAADRAERPATPAPTGGATAPAALSVDGAVAYVRGERLVVVERGSARTLFTADAGGILRDPSFSPDGRSLAFAYTPPVVGSSLGVLRVDLTVDSNSQALSPNAYHLVDDIVLRNTKRT